MPRCYLWCTTAHPKNSKRYRVAYKILRHRQFYRLGLAIIGFHSRKMISGAGGKKSATTTDVTCIVNDARKHTNIRNQGIRRVTYSAHVTALCQDYQEVCEMQKCARDISVETKYFTYFHLQPAVNISHRYIFCNSHTNLFSEAQISCCFISLPINLCLKWPRGTTQRVNKNLSSSL